MAEISTGLILKALGFLWAKGRAFIGFFYPPILPLLADVDISGGVNTDLLFSARFLRSSGKRISIYLQFTPLTVFPTTNWNCVIDTRAAPTFKIKEIHEYYKTVPINLTLARAQITQDRIGSELFIHDMMSQEDQRLTNLTEYGCIITTIIKESGGYEYTYPIIFLPYKKDHLYMEPIYLGCNFINSLPKSKKSLISEL